MRPILLPLLAFAAEGAHAQGFSDTFEALDERHWHRAHYQFNHPMFDTDWDKDLVSFDAGLILSLQPQEAENKFVGASIRREDTTHYGLYEAELQAAHGPGFITGFFLYTGPAYGTQHDEIDWEFFGKDPTTAQAAWFENGELRQKKIDLGFDASSSVNRYGILWEPDKIAWFVNGVRVFETTEAVPQTPQRLFTNLWAADQSVANWAGRTVEGTFASARAKRVRFLPLAQLQRDD